MLRSSPRSAGPERAPHRTSGLASGPNFPFQSLSMDGRSRTWENVDRIFCTCAANGSSACDERDRYQATHQGSDEDGAAAPPQGHPDQRRLYAARVRRQRAEGGVPHERGAGLPRDDHRAPARRRPRPRGQPKRAAARAIPSCSRPSRKNNPIFASVSAPWLPGDSAGDMLPANPGAFGRASLDHQMFGLAGGDTWTQRRRRRWR